MTETEKNYSPNFHNDFQALTGHAPFPWQHKLFGEFIVGRFRDDCPIPTGLGKTSIISIWLLALANRVFNGTLTGFPRRLVYVVNRRTVVDQATREAEEIRNSLIAKGELQNITRALQSLPIKIGGAPLAISTLRGQFVDNAEWRDDPARPAVIIGTVDMIGSRLLFSGYGCGFKSRPLHAGFLGQDTLLVHDEAHLEPAFQELIKSIATEQRRSGEFSHFRVTALTATSRSAASSEDSLFTENDQLHEEVRKRIDAKKGIAFHQVDDDKKVVEKVEHLAIQYKNSGQAILIFLRKLEDVKKVAASLRKMTPDNVETLTGTLRGWERDKLATENSIFARFMRTPEVTPRQGTVYLVCTSAGEVGVNISADHLISDLTPFDSMAQRFGRVNRFGGGDALIDIVHCISDNKTKSPATEPPSSNGSASITEMSKKDKPPSPFDQACVRSYFLMQNLTKRADRRYDASPTALDKLAVVDRQAAFTPPPVILPASDILFDAWALTTVRQKLPGRSPVAAWLHGIAEWEPPETHVAWRDEVDLIHSELAVGLSLEDLLEDYPIKPFELLRDQTARIFAELDKIASRCPEMNAWHIDAEGKIEVYSMSKLVERDKYKKPIVDFADCTVLLSPLAGGLKNGMLDGDAVFGEADRDSSGFDISDKLTGKDNSLCRCRLWDEQKPPTAMRQVRTIDIGNKIDGDREESTQAYGRRYWNWYVKLGLSDDDSSQTARVQQDLLPHLRLAKKFAAKLVFKLGLNESEASAVVFAAAKHDYGKNRRIWQRSIGNNDNRVVLAKSGPEMRPMDITGYRHEFGSLIDISNSPEFLSLAADVQDLALHLVAAHHGRARPHFPMHEAFDHDNTEEAAANIADEVPRRFGRLQRKYGRWGLAYLESLVRSADITASQAVNDADSEDLTIPKEVPYEHHDSNPRRTD